VTKFQLSSSSALGVVVENVTYRLGGVKLRLADKLSFISQKRCVGGKIA